MKNSFVCTAFCGLSLLLPLTIAAQDGQLRDATAGATSITVAPASTPALQRISSATEFSDVEELPDSPGAEWAKSQPSSSQESMPPQSGQNTAQTATDQNTQEKAQHPVGTAAAEAPRVTGVTAAEPAGVAIAPAKQHRVRTIVLKVGAIVGAGAALGTVVALTAATSSKPPGAH